MNYHAEFNSLAGETTNLLQEAQRLSELTIPALQPIPTSETGKYRFSSEDSSAGTSAGIKRPATDIGARGHKGLASTIVSTLAPANISWHRLDYDASLNIDEANSQLVDKLYRKQELRIGSWLKLKGFTAFAYEVIERNLIEGSNCVKVSLDGCRLYPLRSFVVQRSEGKVSKIIIQEVVTDSKGSKKFQYICVDKLANKVYLQGQDDKEPMLMDGEYASQYFVVTATTPHIGNYPRAYFSDHYGLLYELNDNATDLSTARKNCNWNWLMLSNNSRLSTSQIANIKPREVVRVEDPTGIVPFSFARNISEWSFMYQKYTEDAQSFLTLCAVGLQQRASQIQTATEVREIKAELEAITGTIAQGYATSLFQATIHALVDLLGIRDNIKQAINNEGLEVTSEQLELLVQPVVVTGVPALAREADAERLFNFVSTTAKQFGPQVTAQLFNIKEVLKEVMEGLRLPTDKLMAQDAPDPTQVLQATTAAEAEQFGPEIEALLRQSQRGEQA